MKCKWHKEVMRDADKYGDDPNAVDFLESEYVEIFNGMMSQYYPYPYQQKINKNNKEKIQL